MTRYASLEEKGYTVEAFMPSSSSEPLAWTVRVSRGKELVREVRVPMSYEPRFGPDADDVRVLEEETAKLLAALA